LTVRTPYYCPKATDTGSSHLPLHCGQPCTGTLRSSTSGRTRPRRSPPVSTSTRPTVRPVSLTALSVPCRPRKTLFLIRSTPTVVGMSSREPRVSSYAGTPLSLSLYDQCSRSQCKAE
jgi:hypothetical protein